MKKYILSALMLMGLSANAQTITFDTQDYAKVSVYDNWVKSPFRTGELKGNAAVVANPNTAVDEVFGSAPDGTKNVVAVQRSRFGSNSFGVRIDLKEPFRLTKTNRYIHIMAYMPGKPVGSKVMVMGLGKRVEDAWNWQTGEDEQFWAQTIGNVEGKDGWQDLVVSIKGFSYSKEENPDSGIDIYSLVIVPDVRSAHEDQSDWIAYFDEIVIDESADKRFSTDKYAVSFDKDAAITRTDRYLNGVGLGTQSVTGIKDHFYNDCTKTTVFGATPGEKVQPKFTYTGSWMSGYVYVDWGNDGKFSYNINSNGTPGEGSDIVSYNAYSANGSTWYKSDGSTASNGNTIGSGVPTFTIPADQAIGFYRMRYKVDWNNIDPAGNSDSGNLITSNGGAIADVLLDIHESEVIVNANQLNGDILATDGSALMKYPVPYGKDLTVQMVPAPGFVHNGMTVRCGYNIAAEAQLDSNGNPNWLEVEIPVGESDTYVIPAAYIVGGNVQITGYFKSSNTSEEFQALLKEAREALDHEGVGFPKASSAERIALQEAINAENPSEKAVKDALDALYACTDVEHIQLDHVYTLTAVTREHRKAYFNTVILENGDYDVQPVLINADTVLPETAYFRVSWDVEDECYYLMPTCVSDYIYGQSGKRGIRIQKADASDTFDSKFFKSELVDAEAKDLYGLVTLYHKFSGYFTADTPNEEPWVILPDDDASFEAPSYNWDRTSALSIQEVPNINAMTLLNSKEILDVANTFGQICVASVSNTNGRWINFGNNTSCPKVNEQPAEENIFKLMPASTSGRFYIYREGEGYLTATAGVFSASASDKAEFWTAGYGDDNWLGGDAFTNDSSIDYDATPVDNHMIRIYLNDGATWFNCSDGTAAKYNTGGGAWTVFHVFSYGDSYGTVTENYLDIEERPATVLEGKTITSLSELKNDMAYFIHAQSGEGYLVWNESITDTYVSLRGVENTSYNGGPGNALFEEAVDPFDATCVWQLLVKEGKFYMYQPAKKNFVTRVSRDYVFTEEETALDGIRDNGDGTFSIHAGGGMSDTSTNYACICTNEAQTAVRNWTYSDHGSIFYITENPNIEVTDIFLPDGISAPETEKANPVIYDLMGRRVAITRPGIYIIDDKKVVIK